MPKTLKPKIKILDTNRKDNEEFMISLCHRNIPTKFQYWGNKETQNWLDVCKDPQYINWQLEIDLLSTDLPEIVKLVNPKVKNLVSLGIGNGEKDKMIMNAFLKNRPMRYFAIDVSLHMVKAGLKTLQEVPGEKTAYIGDFEHLEKLAPKIRKQTKSGNLISILGNTLGNLDQITTLNFIRRSMDKNDYLLFAVQILEKGKILDIGDILSAYNTKVLQKLSFGAIMRSGLKRTDGVIEIEFGRNKLYPQFNTIEYFFTFKKDKTIKYLNREINFKTGERILTYYSYKYDKKNMTFLLNNNGFEIVRYFFSPGQKYLLALAKLK
ncbi:L-histidine N(alpha)-methyltransferase [Patescibacteria group bacterium]|nr:L-histidine N(alpha)-methyltransferase [Patescibacteria group bacterium]MBU1954275.1 L-histidine N(alpha)-methyltransferase [Patescibacteria group bacterium]